MGRQGAGGDRERERQRQHLRIASGMANPDPRGVIFSSFVNRMLLRRPHEVSELHTTWSGPNYTFEDAEGNSVALREFFIRDGQTIPYTISELCSVVPPFPTALGKALRLIREVYAARLRSSDLAFFMTLVSFFKFFKWELTIGPDLPFSREGPEIALLVYRRFNPNDENDFVYLDVNQEDPSRLIVSGRETPDWLDPAELVNHHIVIREEVTCNLNLLKPTDGRGRPVSPQLLPVPRHVLFLVNNTLSRKCESYGDWSPVFSYFIASFKECLDVLRDNIPPGSHVPFLASLRNGGGIKITYEDFAFRIMDSSGRLIAERLALPFDYDPFEGLVPAPGEDEEEEESHIPPE